MSFGSPTKSCPRCNTLLPAQATVCSTCGMQFPDWASSQPASGYGTTQYGGQNAPGGWPQNQPPYQTPIQPWQPDPQGYAPQPVYGGYPAAPVAAPPRKGNTGLIVTILLVVVVVGGGIAAWFLYLNPGRCSGPLFDRHGQPGSIPMPSGCVFNTMRTEDLGTGLTADYWFWTVDSPNNPSALHSFYLQNLSGNGWTKKADRTSSDGIQLGYCGNGLAVEIDLLTKIQTGNSSTLGAALDITAPSGGSVLAIGVVSNSRVVAQACG